MDSGAQDGGDFRTKPGAGELVPEYRTEQTGEMQLPMQTDQKADRQICIPLESGTKAENVVVETITWRRNSGST